MSTPYSPPKAVTETMHASYNKNGDSIVAIQRAARLLLPNYGQRPSQAAEAVRAGKGNCFAHTEVVAAVASQLPGVTPLVSLQRYMFSRRLHAECAVVTPDHDIALINNAGRSPNRRSVDFHGTSAEALAARALRQARIVPPIVVHGLQYDTDWVTSRVDSLETALAPDDDDEKKEERLVMTLDVGLPTLHTISSAHRLWREREVEDYNELYAANQTVLSHFGLQPLEVA